MDPPISERILAGGGRLRAYISFDNGVPQAYGPSSFGDLHTSFGIVRHVFVCNMINNIIATMFPRRGIRDKTIPEKYRAEFSFVFGSTHFRRSRVTKQM
jgi:hypothetical protein